MNIYQLIGEHPWISFFLTYIIVSGIGKIVYRVCRIWVLQKHGYPPAHCDADGDLKKTEESK